MGPAYSRESLTMEEEIRRRNQSEGSMRRIDLMLLALEIE